MRRKLDGLTVVVTRGVEQSSEICAQITELGGLPCLLPSIEIVSIRSQKVAGIFQRIDDFDWLIFTSANAVRQSFEILECLGISPAALAGRFDVAVVGAQTAAALSRENVEVSMTANPANASTLLQLLRQEEIASANILIPASKIAGNEIADGLRESGASVTVVPVYDTRCPLSVPLRAAEHIRRGEVDVVTFASPSAVGNFISLVGGDSLDDTPIACIGNLTASAVRGFGYAPAIIPEQASMTCLLNAVSRKLLGQELKRM